MSEILFKSTAWRRIMEDERLSNARTRLSFHEIRLMIHHVREAAGAELAEVRESMTYRTSLIGRMTARAEAAEGLIDWILENHEDWMSHDYDITTHPSFGWDKSNAQKYFEARVAAEREEAAA